MTDNPFDEKATTWDDDPGHIERARVVADRISENVVLGSDMSTLEYGAGTGLVAEMLASAVGPLTLVDTSAGMRSVIESKIASGRLTGAVVDDFDLATDNVPDTAFDLVVTVLTLHHMDDTAAALRGLRSLVSESGALCIVDLDSEDGSFHGQGTDVHHGFDRAGLTRLLHAAGFASVRMFDCHHIERDDGTYPMFLAVASSTDAVFRTNGLS